VPVHPSGDGDADPVVTFDTRVAVSPFDLFRSLREGRAPLLIDLRGEPRLGGAGGAGGTADPGRLALRGAEPYPGPGWQPPADREVVLIDDDGRRASEEARRLQDAGFSRVRALFGGLALYEFALDPDVVGEDSWLERTG
jgi:rhodanese-related sulfurtransferase